MEGPGSKPVEKTISIGENSWTIRKLPKKSGGPGTSAAAGTPPPLLAPGDLAPGTFVVLVELASPAGKAFNGTRAKIKHLDTESRR